MTRRVTSLASAAAWLLAVGLAVGLVSGHWAAGSGASACADGAAGLPCLEFTRSMGIRVGFVTGIMAMVMTLTWAGLSRMTVQDERRRATLARESDTRARGALP